MRLEFAAAIARSKGAQPLRRQAPCRVSALAVAAAEADTARRKGTVTAIGFPPAAAPGHNSMNPLGSL